MCEYVDSPYLVAGWVCCRCRVYNDLVRNRCKQCGGARCTPLSPDRMTGKTLES